MRKHMKLILLVLAILITVPAGQSMAENKPGSIGLTFFFGGYTFDPDQDLDTEFTVGLGLGYSITRNWGVEAMFNTVDTDDDLRFDASAKVYHVDGLYHFTPEKNLVPYIAAGLGAISLNYDNFLYSSGTDFMVNYGGGLKYFLSESVALRADLRHIISFNDTNHNLRYTLGLLFSFGGTKKKADSDGDSVFDDYDKCPDTPMNVSVDSFGCPNDTDGDGIPDYLDKCPDNRKGIPVDSSGCPKDSDSDGVFDYLDMCENTPAGIPVDKYGCPADEPVSPEVTEKGTYVFRNIQFDTGRATIKQSSYPVLNYVVKFLEDQQDLEIEIQGHTDNTGTEDYNLTLSEKRAMAIMEYLVGKGVSPERLTAKGYGSSMPTAGNDTREGRALNRRVEFAPMNR